MTDDEMCRMIARVVTKVTGALSFSLTWFDGVKAHSVLWVRPEHDERRREGEAER